MVSQRERSVIQKAQALLQKRHLALLLALDDAHTGLRAAEERARAAQVALQEQRQRYGEQFRLARENWTTEDLAELGYVPDGHRRGARATGLAEGDSSRSAAPVGADVQAGVHVEAAAGAGGGDGRDEGDGRDAAGELFADGSGQDSESHAVAV